MTQAPDPDHEMMSKIDQAIHEVAGALKTLPAGQQAELRRLAADDPASPVFFRVMSRYVEPYMQVPGTSAALCERERRWAVILRCMASLSHKKDERLGCVLADTGFSEMRFARLLRSHGAGLADELRAATHFLVSRGRNVDWFDGARLVLSDGKDWEEKTRRILARQYYGYKPRTEGDTTPAEQAS